MRPKHAALSLALRLIGMALMAALSVSLLFPYLWMLSTSLKLDTEVFRFPIQWFPDPLQWKNYAAVWTKIPLLLYYFNTVKITALTTLLQYFVCATAAYAFARLRFRLKNVVFMIFLSTMMVPWHSIMIPQFLIVSRMGLYDTHAGLILVQSFNAFGIFLLRQFFMGIPMEMSEAARIDGCSEWRIFTQIMLPLSGPGLVTLGIFTFMHSWNDYLAPLIYLQSPEKATIQIGLTAFMGERTMEYATIMAGTVCALLPIILLYVFAERYIAQGIAFSGIKN